LRFVNCVYQINDDDDDDDACWSQPELWSADIDRKKDVKTFFYVFYFGHVFITFLTFFIFQSFFLIFKKTFAKFRAASRLTRSAFKIAATK